MFIIEHYKTCVRFRSKKNKNILIRFPASKYKLKTRIFSILHTKLEQLNILSLILKYHLVFNAFEKAKDI